MIQLKSRTCAYLGRLDIKQKVAYIIDTEIIASSWIGLVGLGLAHRTVRERNDLVARLEESGFEIRSESPQFYDGPITKEFVERCHDRQYLQDFMAR